MKKSIFRVGCFVILLMLCLGKMNSILKFKYNDGMFGMEKFYEQEKNTVDVLILGTSHAFAHFNVATLWEEHGMATYVLGGSNQPLWNSYHYLVEALKTQKPELIVLDAYGVVREGDYASDDVIIKNNFGLKWSLNKIEAFKASIPKERWAEFFLEYKQYHTRYTDLSEEDFLKDKGRRLFENYKGFYCNMDTVPVENNFLEKSTDTTELPEKSEQYYRKIMELAKEEGIPMVVVMSPFPTYYERSQSNRAAEIAAEYGVNYIDCNFYAGEMGLDYTTDAADPGHLNYRGNQKFTKYIGNYLKEHYEISDRRGEEKYESWNSYTDTLNRAIENQMLSEIEDFHLLKDKLGDENYSVIISVDGDCDSSESNLKELFAVLGILPDGKQGIWYRDKGQIAWYSYEEEAEEYIRLGRTDISMKREKEGKDIYSNYLTVNRKNAQMVENGVNIIVYDTLNEEVADIFGIDVENDYAMVR